MKKNILTILGGAFLLFSLSSSSFGAQGIYLSGSIGFAMLSDAGITAPELRDMGVSADIESKSGTAFGFGLGYDFDKSLRVEVEYAYQKNDADRLTMAYEDGDMGFGLEGETTSRSFLVNAYYDFSNATAVTPYMSTGIGYSRVEAEITGMSGYDAVVGEENLEIGGREDDTVIAYHIGAGIGVAVSESLTLDARYRFFATEDLDFNGVNVEYSTHNFYAGIRLGF